MGERLNKTRRELNFDEPWIVSSSRLAQMFRFADASSLYLLASREGSNWRGQDKYIPDDNTSLLEIPRYRYSAVFTHGTGNSFLKSQVDFVYVSLTCL